MWATKRILKILQRAEMKYADFPLKSLYFIKKCTEEAVTIFHSQATIQFSHIFNYNESYAASSTFDLIAILKNLRSAPKDFLYFKTNAILIFHFSYNYYFYGKNPVLFFLRIY